MVQEEYDYLIVGCGLSGCVVAERLSSIGRSVLMIDRRSHIGGNCHDYIDEAGVLVHKYGPHYFRTDFPEVREYLSAFTEWIPQRYVVKASVKGEIYDIPINRNTLNKFFGLNMVTDNEAKFFLESIRDKTITVPKNAEEQVLMLAGRQIYDVFFRNYTRKQWGCDPRGLDPSVTARIPVRYNDDQSYFSASFQAMPRGGYTKMIEKMVAGRKNITIRLGVDYRETKEDVDKGNVKYRKLIFTGPIDEFFGYKHGRLKYRSMEFKHKSIYGREFFQDFSQVNYPGDEEFTRIVEIKHVTLQVCPNTTVVYEYPKAEGDPFYPVPSESERALYEKYRAEAAELRNVFFAGRLGTYRYLNMDQVVKESLALFGRIENE